MDLGRWCIRVGTACNKGVWPFEAATRDSQESANSRELAATRVWLGGIAGGGVPFYDSKAVESGRLYAASLRLGKGRAIDLAAESRGSGAT